MRRFLIWSALAAILGLAIAIGGYWAYWNFYARFQPVTITRNQAQIQRLLDEASWLSAGGGGEPLYIVGYRDSASTQAYEQGESDKLRAAGVEVRVIVFARPDREGLAQSTAAERATVAELWLTRDWTLYQRWTATPTRDWTAAGIPAADGNLARSAVVEASRQFATRLTDMLGDAGVHSGYPIVIWRDREGFMKACACSDKRSWTFIRDDVGAPDAVAPTVSADPGFAPSTAAPVEGGPATLPYPDLPTIPPVDNSAPPVADNAPPVTQTPSRPPVTRGPPQAKKQEDSTFF